MACDLRICSERARFGVPVSRTLGNCLSIANTARMVDLIGVAMTKDLMLTGRLVDADEAYRARLATRVYLAAELSGEVMALAAELSTRARSTIVATKALLLRLRDHRRPPAGSADDIIRECYASSEFKEGVVSFLAGRKPNWY
jgi:enoyl-CoA hydratase/carnithine racemase